MESMVVGGSTLGRVLKIVVTDDRGTCIRIKAITWVRSRLIYFYGEIV